MKRFAFTSRMHMKRSADFERTYAGRRSAQNATCRVVAAPNELPHSRLGLSVGKKYGNAVRRNRFKRLVREAFRLNRDKLPVGFDIVVIPRTKSEPTLDEVSASLIRLANKAARKHSTGTMTKEKSSGLAIK